MERTLAILAEGQSGTVTGICPGCPLYERLRDIGLTAGTTVTCLHISPAGDPAAYRIRGAVIALRKEDAKTVSLRLLP